MEELFYRIRAGIPGLAPHLLADRNGLISKTLIEINASLSSISVRQLKYRGKDLPLKQQEMVGADISKVLYGALLLTALLEVNEEVFSLENLEDLADTSDPEYQECSIMCAFNMTRATVCLMDIANTLEGEIPPGMCEYEEPEEALAYLLAGCLILVERFELDLEAVMYNAGILAPEVPEEAPSELDVEVTLQ